VALTAAGASEFVRQIGPIQPAVADGQALDALTIDQNGAPVPVSAPVAQMFAVAFGDTSVCISRDEVVKRLRADVKSYGGQVVLLEDGLEQSFSDQWRREVHTPTIKVSGVVAHLFGDRRNNDWTADVVEFDRNGCAMSRTAVPGDVWMTILQEAVGVEV
jgi:hypothetical protein